MRPRIFQAARILSDDEVAAISKARGIFVGASQGPTALSRQNLEDRIRFRAVRARLLLARQRRGLSLEQAGEKLKEPPPVLAALETGAVAQTTPELLSKYISFLGLEHWFERWKSHNQKLARRLEGPKGSFSI